ncbi:MAG: phosphatase PAP2 family protein [Bacteroidia bacterium]|nr:MAG: phosphatase PAP2 family protein [Bacteroidia bacterium]
MNKIRSAINYHLDSTIAIKLFIEIVLGTAVTLFVLYLFLQISDEVLDQDINLIDSQISQFIYTLRTPELTKVMFFFTYLASPFILIVGSVISASIIAFYRKKDALIYLCILFSAVLVNGYLKYFFQRPRPTLDALIHENSYSFPSGHAMNGFMFYSLLAYFIYRETENLKLTFIITLICGFIILMIGISRVYLGVHYPSDVIAGYLAGFIWLAFAIIFEKVIIFKRLKHAKKS